MLFPLWTASEYAELCASGSWAGFEPREIDLHSLFERLIPSLQESGAAVGVFPTPFHKGILPELEQLVANLREELSRIE